MFLQARGLTPSKAIALAPVSDGAVDAGVAAELEEELEGCCVAPLLVSSAMGRVAWGSGDDAVCA